LTLEGGGGKKSVRELAVDSKKSQAVLAVKSSGLPRKSMTVLRKRIGLARGISRKPGGGKGGRNTIAPRKAREKREADPTGHHQKIGPITGTPQQTDVKKSKKRNLTTITA